MKKRIEWLDLLKGWGMILVMFAHASLPDELRKYIYTFHMPLFFFISGYLLSINKYNNIKEFLKSKLKSLLIPYFIFSIFNYMFYLIFSRFANHVSENPIKPLLGIFIGIRGTDWTLCNGTLWFILVLFISELLLYFIIELSTDNNKTISLCLFIFSLIGYLYSNFIGIRLVWSIDIAFTAVVFLGIGYLIKKNNYIEKYGDKKYILVSLIISIITGMINTEVNMFGSVYGNYILFYLSAISGIYLNILIIKELPNIKTVNFIGKNTFVYLALHQYVVYSVLKKISEKLLGHVTNSISMTIISILFVCITVLVLYPFIKFVNKFIPFAVGKKIIDDKIELTV